MNPVRDAVILVVYEAIVLVCYIVLSDPIIDLFDAIGTAGADTTGLASGVHYSSLVFMMCFAIGALIPVFWFMFRVFSREQDWGYQ